MDPKESYQYCYRFLWKESEVILSAQIKKEDSISHSPAHIYEIVQVSYTAVSFVNVPTMEEAFFFLNPISNI